MYKQICTFPAHCAINFFLSPNMSPVYRPVFMSLSLHRFSVHSLTTTYTLTRHTVFDHSLSWMNGCVRAWLMEMRLLGSSMRVESRRSFSCRTFFSWSSGRRWYPINSANRSLLALMVLRTETFSYKTHIHRSYLTILVKGQDSSLSLYMYMLSKWSPNPNLHLPWDKTPCQDSIMRLVIK